MITLLTGRVVHRTPSEIELETSGGVGYEVHIPLSVFSQLPPDGERLTLHTHLTVREDGWELYGFLTRYERAVFRRVLNAKGVGPALALGILSTIGADRVVEAIRLREVATLVRVPRVGRRKAEQIILDLAEKMDDLASSATTSVAGTPSGPPRSGAGADAVRALVALGYAEADARTAVGQATRTAPATSAVSGPPLRVALTILNG